MSFITMFSFNRGASKRNCTGIKGNGFQQVCRLWIWNTSVRSGEAALNSQLMKNKKRGAGSTMFELYVGFSLFLDAAAPSLHL